MLLLVIIIITSIKQNSLYDQTFADRWSADEPMSQLTVIYPLAAGEKDDFYFMGLKHDILSKLSENSDIEDYPDAVSIKGSIGLSRNGSQVNVTAYGVDRDFFLFHPVSLQYGSYLDSDDLMKDGIIIDKDIAWSLFGAFDVVGMEVYVGDTSLLVKGVMDKPEGRLAEEAGLKDSTCFVSIGTLKNMGVEAGSYIYEAVLPNPVDGYGLKLMTDHYSGDDTIRIVENSERYSDSNLRKVIGDFGLRSMNGNGYVYPYFENVARAWEDYFAIILLVRYILTGIILIVVGITLYDFIKSDIYKTLRKKRSILWERLKESLQQHLPVL